MKNAVFWDMTPVALVRIDISADLIVSIIKVKRISELSITSAVTNN
jgi:hypothetical protein